MSTTRQKISNDKESKLSDIGRTSFKSHYTCLSTCHENSEVEKEKGDRSHTLSGQEVTKDYQSSIIDSSMYPVSLFHEAQEENFNTFLSSDIQNSNKIEDFRDLNIHLAMNEGNEVFGSADDIHFLTYPKKTEKYLYSNKMFQSKENSCIPVTCHESASNHSKQMKQLSLVFAKED